MSLGAYVRSQALEFALLLVCSWSVATTVMEGFWVDQALRFSPLTPALCALLLVACFVAAWRYEWRFAGVAGVIALAAVVAIVAAALSSGEGGPWDDVPENYLTYAACVVFSAVASFLLTRTLPGSAVLFVACALACALMQAFYGQHLLGWAIAAIASSLTLVVWRNCSRARAGGGERALTRGSTPAVAFLTALVPVALCVGAACGVWFGVIEPLQPGIVELKLIVDYRNPDVVQVKGVSDTKMRTDTSTTSQNMVDGAPYTTDDLKVDPDAAKEIPAKTVPEDALARAGAGDNAGAADASQGTEAGSRDTIDPDSLEDVYDQVSYSLDFPFVWVVIALSLLLVLAVVGYFVWRRWNRTRRLAGFLELSRASGQVEAIYLFLLRKMGCIGFSVPQGSTLLRWSQSGVRTMDGLRASTGVPFAALTDIYVRCAYGKHEPTDDEVALMVAFYDGFWKAARDHLGNVRYFFKSFRLG